jgi:uncharacterized protein (DUF2249 family)
VFDVLARDESLVDVFVRHAPHFSKLKNRAMRRVMARLITVEQAARTAGIPTELLLHDLNRALGLADAPPSNPGATELYDAGTARSGASATGAPSLSYATAGAGTVTRPLHAPVREIDVREDLRSGNEPFSKIMAAVAALRDGELLRLRATFEPVPLFTVLGKRGFIHESQEHGPDDWSVWFWRPSPESAGGAESSGSATTTPAPVAKASAATTAGPGAEAQVPDDALDDDDGKTLRLDVRGLNPPEPLMRTLAALETLPAGHQLLQINARVPQFLFPMLVERGFACEVDESHADRVLVRIWRPA